MITYHKKISKVKYTILFHFNNFSEDIKSFLKERELVQEIYDIASNKYYLFIYLNNGDRIDVAL